MKIKNKNLAIIAFLTLITFGFYKLYWAYQSKKELENLGAKVPSVWYLLFPFGHLYFWYKYSENFDKFIVKNNKTINYFIISLFPFIIQSIGTIFLVIYQFNIVTLFVNGNYFNFGLYTIPFLEIAFIPMMVFQIGFNEMAAHKDNNNELKQ